MEYNLRDAVLCPALHWDTDIVSVGERHAQARAAAEFRSYHGGWAQAGVLRKKESLRFLELGTAASETENDLQTISCFVGHFCDKNQVCPTGQ